MPSEVRIVSVLGLVVLWPEIAVPIVLFGKVQLVMQNSLV